METTIKKKIFIKFNLIMDYKIICTTSSVLGLRVE